MEDINNIAEGNKEIRMGAELWASIKEPIPVDHKNYKELHKLLEQLKRAAKAKDTRFIIKDDEIDTMEGIWNWEKDWFEFIPINDE